MYFVWNDKDNYNWRSHADSHTGLNDIKTCRLADCVQDYTIKPFYDFVEKRASELYYNGNYIRFCIVPHDSGGHGLKDHKKIIMSEKYNILDIKIIKKFKLYMYDVCRSGMLESASRMGYIWVLDFLKNSGLPLQYFDNALNYASQNGHIEVLEWWRNSGLELKYSEYALNEASKSGHIHVLEWWKNSGLPLKYTEYALTEVSRNGHVNVLEWWFKSNLQLKYNGWVLYTASINGHVNVLEWWKNSGLRLQYTEDGLDYATKYGHIEVLEWWKNSGLELKSNAMYKSRLVLEESIKDMVKHIKALEWWINFLEKS
jgi:hypothetical protein